MRSYATIYFFMLKLYIHLEGYRPSVASIAIKILENFSVIVDI